MASWVIRRPCTTACLGRSADPGADESELPCDTKIMALQVLSYLLLDRCHDVMLHSVLHAMECQWHVGTWTTACHNAWKIGGM